MHAVQKLKKEIESSIVRLEAERRAIDDQLRLLLAMLNAGEKSTKRIVRKILKKRGRGKRERGVKRRLTASMWKSINAMLDAKFTHGMISRKLGVSVSTVARARSRKEAERSAA